MRLKLKLTVELEIALGTPRPAYLRNGGVVYGIPPLDMKLIPEGSYRAWASPLVGKIRPRNHGRLR